MLRFPPLPRPLGVPVARWILPTGLFLVVWTAPGLTVLLAHEEPGLLPWVIGSSVALLWLVGVVARSVDRWREWYWQRLRKKHRREPWRVDHRWDERSARRSRVQAFVDTGLGRALLVLAVLGVVGLMAWNLRDPSGPWVACGAAFAAACVVLRAFARVSRGAVDVLFPRFPFHPGEPVELHVGAEPGGPTLEDCVLTLRRIHEIPRSRWSFWSREVSALWAVHRVPASPPGPEQFVVVTFDVPASVGGTCLSSLAPTYWELVVLARVDGRPFLERFLIPVYERAR